MRRALVPALALAFAVPAHGAVPARAEGSDPKGDLVNPAAGIHLPGPAAYSYPAQDIRAFSLWADGALLHASVSTEGRWRDWVEQPAWATLPSMLVLFRSPRLVTGLCPYCEPERGDRYRVGLMFRSTACPGDFPPVTSLVVWDPYEMRPLALAGNVPYEISADQRTVTLAIPYTYGGYEIAAPGDVLTEVSAQTLTWTAQGAMSSGSCAVAAMAEGSPDWAPAGAWDPVQRVHRTTGISVQA